MLPLKPGQPLQVKKVSTCMTCTLMVAGEKELTLSMAGDMDLLTGDELELEIPQVKEAPYLLRGRVKELGPGGTFTLELVGELIYRERRKHQRIPTNLQAEYYLPKEEPGEPEHLQGKILDISSGGAFLSTRKPLELGSKLMLLLRIPLGRDEESITGIGGRVVRRHKGQVPLDYGYGVEFSRSLELSG